MRQALDCRRRRARAGRGWGDARLVELNEEYDPRVESSEGVNGHVLARLFVSRAWPQSASIEAEQTATLKMQLLAEQMVFALQPSLEKWAHSF